MHFLKLSIILLFSVHFSQLFLSAQSMLYFKENSGTQTSFTLSDISKLILDEGNVLVHKTDGNSNSYAITDIRYLSFNDFMTRTPLIPCERNSTTILYPNPADDLLQIRFETVKEGNVYLEIADIQGRILQREYTTSQTGSNHWLINISRLPAGLYICRLKNRNILETIKFIKY